MMVATSVKKRKYDTTLRKMKWDIQKNLLDKIMGSTKDGII